MHATPFYDVYHTQNESFTRSSNDFKVLYSEKTLWVITDLIKIASCVICRSEDSHAWLLEPGSPKSLCL